MQLVSVNLGHERAIKNGKPSGKTGIYKLPTSEAVQVTSEGLPGDFICDTKNHGGADQALYVYGVPDYEWWAGQLGRELEPGTFGENLTVSGLLSNDFSIGDFLYVGEVTLQVTAPRIPCATLAARMDDPAFVKRFRHGERPGLYCRVLMEGSIRVGDVVRREAYSGETVSALDVFRNWYEPIEDEDWIRRYKASPLAVRAEKKKM
jgi:MOSC domain-containing protein YiiM